MSLKPDPLQVVPGVWKVSLRRFGREFHRGGFAGPPCSMRIEYAMVGEKTIRTISRQTVSHVGTI